MAYKQHFIEWFSGKQLPSYWTQVNTSGTGIIAMEDSVDGGFSITSGATVANNTQITFNNKRQYNPTSCEIISVMRRNTGGTLSVSAMANTAAVTSQFFDMEDDTSDGFKTLGSANATFSQISSDVVSNTDWTNYKGVVSASDIKMYINGVLKVTKTTNRPSLVLQPTLMSKSRTAGAKQTSFRYLECYNT